MVNLVDQHLKIETEINAALASLIRQSSFINGPAVSEFSKNLSLYNHSPFVITCGNGTDALQISLMALNLEAGDEIIMPAFSYAAAAEAAALLKLKPVFVDVSPGTFNLDVSKIEKAITSRSRTILPVHLFGQSADMEEILLLAKQYNLTVIEDNAQAIGGEYIFADGSKQKTAALGNIGITSFFPSKNLGCFGDGGAIFTKDDALAERMDMIANHGQSEKYLHEIIGVNSRLDSIQASILNIKLQYLNNYIQARQQAAAYYDKAFSGIPEIAIPSRSPNATHVFHQYTLKVENGKRQELQGYLQTKGIPTMIYYPKPVHLQPAYRYLGYKKGDFPVSESLCEKVLSLPMHTELTADQLEYICGSVKEFFI